MAGRTEDTDPQGKGRQDNRRALQDTAEQQKGKNSRRDAYLNFVKCWQLNLYRSRAASYNLGEELKKVDTGMVLIQEPWVYGDVIRGRLGGWNLFQCNGEGERPRTCVYASHNLKAQLLPMFSNEDVAAVRVKNVYREGDSYVFASVYMANENPAPPRLLGELADYCEGAKKPLIEGSDANAHRTVWGSSDTNSRGEELLEFCAQSNLEICNVGNKSTFRTKVRKEVLDLTLANRWAWDGVCDWHVSDVPSFSDHMLIWFGVGSTIFKRIK